MKDPDTHAKLMNIRISVAIVSAWAETALRDIDTTLRLLEEADNELHALP